MQFGDPLQARKLLQPSHGLVGRPADSGARTGHQLDPELRLRIPAHWLDALHWSTDLWVSFPAVWVDCRQDPAWKTATRRYAAGPASAARSRTWRWVRNH